MFVAPVNAQLAATPASPEADLGASRGEQLAGGAKRCQRWNGAAPESNRPSDGLRRLTRFEDALGHQALPLRLAI
jgi:hypothetical protein